MPTYEYSCGACGAGWEQEQRISEDPIKVCPECGAPQAKRLISGGNFMLKGAGWYKDLYHKPAGAKKSGGDSGGSSSGGSSSGGGGSSGGDSGGSSSGGDSGGGSSTGGESKTA
jgi:putative FmdB family regulatory protein